MVAPQWSSPVCLAMGLKEPTQPVALQFAGRATSKACCLRGKEAGSLGICKNQFPSVSRRKRPPFASDWIVRPSSFSPFDFASDRVEGSLTGLLSLEPGQHYSPLKVRLRTYWHEFQDWPGLPPWLLQREPLRRDLRALRRTTISWDSSWWIKQSNGQQHELGSDYEMIVWYVKAKDI